MFIPKNIFEFANEKTSDLNLSEKEMFNLFRDKEQEEQKRLNSLKDNIQIIRLLGKYSLRQFAQICSVSVGTIMEWEKGDFKKKYYWPTVLMLNMKMDIDQEPPTQYFNKLVLYIMFGYYDINYQKNIDKIKIIAQAYKGKANEEQVKSLYNSLQLDKLNFGILDFAVDETTPDLIKYVIESNK